MFGHIPFVDENTPDADYETTPNTLPNDEQWQKIAADFKKAYLWAMSLDNKNLVEQMQKAYKDFTQEENGDKAKQALWKVIDEGIAQKKKLSSTATIKEQIQMLEELKSKIK